MMFVIECVGGPYDGQTCHVDRLFADITVPRPGDEDACTVIADRICPIVGGRAAGIEHRAGPAARTRRRLLRARRRNDRLPLGILGGRMNEPTDPITAPLTRPAAQFRVQPSVIHRLLQLPAAIDIVGVAWDDRRDVIVLKVLDYGATPVLPTDRRADGTAKFVEPVITQEQLHWDFSRVEND